MTVRCGVLGDPIEHSLSPALHRAGYAELGLDWAYDTHRVPAGGLAAFLESALAEDASGRDEWRGLSLTMPLKREVAAVVDRLSDRARLAGAANTIVVERDADGLVDTFGENTDIPGAIASVRQHTGAPLASAAILGGGATATSIGLALADLGARSIVLVVRSPERAGETFEVLTSHPGRPQVQVARLDELAGRELAVDLVASTIPASAQDDSVLAACADTPVLFEALYDPWPTPLAASAGSRPLVTGLDLLVHQAAHQFELFTGQTAPIEAMRAAGERELDRRARA